MENSNDEYHISFFKPTTTQARANRNMVVWLVLIWVVAIFGFQLLLLILEKPTPEPAYLTFQNVWEDVKNGGSDEAQKQSLGQASLSVLGKMAIAAGDKESLNNALSWSVYQLTEESSREALVAEVKAFEGLKASIEDLSDADYIAAKKAISVKFSPILGLAALDVRSKILPLELSSAAMTELSADTKSNLPAVMKKYLVHNQSFLTDTKFIGFPFHYFYTATFLLILFVGLCWLYCVKTDSMNKKLNIID